MRACCFVIKAPRTHPIHFSDCLTVELNIIEKKVLKEMENPAMKELTWEVPILQETWRVPGADKAKYGQIIFHAFLDKYPQHKATFPKLKVSSCESEDFLKFRSNLNSKIFREI